MPIYEYECEQCGNVIEALQKFSDEPLTECSNCSGNLQKLISQSSFHLKGSGWYVTDYAGKKQTSEKEVNTESKKTDSKPEKAAKSSDSTT